MGFQADAVEDENVEVAEAVHSVGGDSFEIGGVGEIVESVGDDGELAVDYLERRYLDLFADAKRRIMHDRVRDQLRQPAAEMGGLKDVLEDTPKVDPRDLVREDRHCTEAKVQRPYIVEPEYVIDVAMRDQHRIQPSDLCPQRLLPEIA